MLIGRWVVGVTILVGASTLVPVSSRGNDAISRAALQSLEKALKSGPRTLRVPANRSLCQFIAVPGGFASYTYDDSPLYPPSAAQVVEIRGLTGYGASVEIRFKTGHLNGSIRVEPAAGHVLTAADLDLVTSEIFTDFKAATHAPIVGNARSRLYHAYSCNHLPDVSVRSAFESADAARIGGFRPCPVCFVSRPKVTDFDTERVLGDFWAGEVRRTYPMVSAGSETARLDSLGQALLRTWPIPLRGYSYDFRIVESRSPNAFACPAGHVFVTTGMLESLESTEEIEGVLAHEICHVERRHGYRQYKRAQRAGLIAAILGVAIGVATDNHDLGTAATAMASLASLAILAGYSRNEEAEADTYALAALHRKNGTNERALVAYANVLSKLQQFESFEGRLRVAGTAFRSHPSIESRISRSQGFQSAVHPVPQTFVGYDSDGEVLVTISLESEAYVDYSDVVLGVAVDGKGRPIHFKGTGGSNDAREAKLVPVKELTVFATVVASPNLPKRVELSAIAITIGGKVHSLDNKEDTELFPGDDAGMSFVSQAESGLLGDKVDLVACAVPGIKRWEKSKEL